MSDGEAFIEGEPLVYGPMTTSPAYWLAWALETTQECNGWRDSRSKRRLRQAGGSLKIRDERGEVLDTDCDNITPVRTTVDKAKAMKRILGSATPALRTELCRYYIGYPKTVPCPDQWATLTANPGTTVTHPKYGAPFRLWVGGIPTEDEISAAPPFTVFAAVRETDDLPTHLTDEFTDEAAYFIGERDDRPYDDQVHRILRPVLLDLFNDPTYELGLFPDFDMDKEEHQAVLRTTAPYWLRFRALRFPYAGFPSRDYDEHRVEPIKSQLWALAAGYTLLKVPDAVSSPYFMTYVLDDVEPSPAGIVGQIADLELLWDAGAPHLPIARKMPGVRPALAEINRARAAMGQRPLDPKRAGWTDEDVILEAQRLRRGSNPAVVQALREALLDF